MYLNLLLFVEDESCFFLFQMNKEKEIINLNQTKQQDWIKTIHLYSNESECIQFIIQ